MMHARAIRRAGGTTIVLRSVEQADTPSGRTTRQRVFRRLPAGLPSVQVRAALREAEIAAYEADTGPTVALSMPDAVDAWIAHSEALAAPTTQTARVRLARDWLAFAGAIGLSDLGREDLARWSDGRKARILATGQPASAATVNTELAHTQAMLDWWESRGYLPRPLSVRAMRESLPFPAPDVPSIEAVKGAIERQQTDRQRAAVFLLAATGVRPAELASLTCGDWRDGALVVPQGRQERTKRHGRVLPLGPGATAQVAVLNGRGPDIPLVGATPREMRRWLAPMGLSPKAFRRWFRTTLQETNCPAYVIDRLMGHSAARVQASYTPQNRGVTPETLRQWLVQVDSLLPKLDLPSL